jgi:hypothetical protein
MFQSFPKCLLLVSECIHNVNRFSTAYDHLASEHSYYFVIVVLNDVHIKAVLRLKINGINPQRIKNYYAIKLKYGKWHFGIHVLYLGLSPKKTEWTFEMRKPVLAVSLAKSRYNAGTILKNCELFIYLCIYDVTNLICKNVLKIATL